MTNTKFRKRMLLSSVAMLLVALVALGSATFAWFSQNSKATASGIIAKTQQGSNIVVSETGSDYKDAITFATYLKGFYNPVTPGGAKINSTSAEVNMDSPVWKKTTASSYDGAVKGTDKQYENANAGTDFTKTDLYVKYDTADTTATQAVDIKMTVTDKNSNPQSATKDFLRVALIPKGTDATALVPHAVVWGNAKDDYAKNPDSMTTNDGSATTSVVTVETGEPMIPNITLTGGKPIQFEVYVWYEGTDPDCIDSNANNNFQIDFEVAKHV